MVCHQDTQTDVIDCSTEMKGGIEGEVSSLLEKNKALAKKVFRVRLSEGNDAVTKFFTGLHRGLCFFMFSCFFLHL